jgi:hypothetical protein
MIKIAYLCKSEVKMMRIIRKIGSIILVSLLIATTGGFSIYHHICNCFGNSSSIFYKATCEHEYALKKASCCSVEKTPSCCAEKPVPASKTTYHKDHCCRNSSYFLKISDSFQPGIEKVTLKPFTVASNLLFFDFAFDENKNPSLNLYNADLPPPDSGKQILVAHHQLKIAPSLV